MLGRILKFVSPLGTPGEDRPLRVRIFQLICATTAVLCLALVLPMNLLQNMPLGVNVDTVLFGLLGAYCYLESRRGRNLVATFLMAAVLMLDLAWFWNAGSQGSVTYFYFPMVIFTLAMFRGQMRWILLGGVALNIGALFVLEARFPGLVTPFHTPLDRLLDHLTGIVGSVAAVSVVGWLILSSHDREQRRISQIAAKLAASEENYREIFNSTSDAMFVHEPAGAVVDFNDRACAMFGFTRESGRLLSINDLSLGVSPYSAVEAALILEKAITQGPQVFEWRSRRRHGELFWSEVALRACKIGGDQRVIAAVRDITERKRAEEQIRANQERLQLSMLASRQGWFEMNVQTGEGLLSPEYIQIVGHEPEGFTTTLQHWLDGIHPEDREKAAAAYRECIAAGDTRTIEYRRQIKSGAWKWIRSVGKIVDYGTDGKPLRMYGTHTDITERKELEAQLLHSQRLEAVGTLASGVAHDLNNILTPILMASEVLREKLIDPRDRELMTLLETGGKRGAAIVKQLLAFSRNLAENRMPVDPRQLMAETVSLLRSALPINIAVVVTEAEDLGYIQAESTQLHQVLLNLGVNGRDAMPAGGTLTLGIDRLEMPPPSPTQIGAPAGGAYVVFSVADTGLGIPAENLERIFDPFFTTKEPGKGTGLGLATVHGIVKAHGGFVRVESSPGRGATFKVFLPAIANPTPRPIVEPPAKRPTGAERRQGECILVVDDDAAVLEVTRRRLVAEGYRVLTAGGGATALQVLQEAAGSVRVVITDFAMPAMDGPTLVPLLRRIDPALKIIGVSGHNHEARSVELQALGFAEVLRKPYESADLLRAIRRQLPVGRADATEASGGAS